VVLFFLRVIIYLTVVGYSCAAWSSDFK